MYTLQSGYSRLLGTRTKLRYAKAIWNPNILPKHAFMLWLTLDQRLLTLDRLSSWYNHSLNTQCLLCLNAEESVSHLFFSCQFSRAVLLEVAEWLGISYILANNSTWRAWLGHCSEGNSVRKGVWLAGIVAVVYWVWQERNCRRHEQVHRGYDLLAKMLNDELKFRIVPLLKRTKRPVEIRFLNGLL